MSWWPERGPKGRPKGCQKNWVRLFFGPPGPLKGVLPLRKKLLSKTLKKINFPQILPKKMMTKTLLLGLIPHQTQSLTQDSYVA